MELQDSVEYKWGGERIGWVEDFFENREKGF